MAGLRRQRRCVDDDAGQVRSRGDFSYDYEDLAFRRVGDCSSTEVSSAKTPPKPAWSTSLRWCPTSPSTSAMPAATTSSARRSTATTHRNATCARAAAQALQRVEEALRKDDLRLQLFDCYRPARAVRHFVRWAGDLADQRTKPRYYPNLDKRTLLGDYIAPVSGHSRGATVDLTLLRVRRGRSLRSRSTWAPISTSSIRARTPTRRTSPRNSAPTASACRRRWRRRVSSNYPYEWWHYTLAPSPHRAGAAMIHDVPVE